MRVRGAGRPERQPEGLRDEVLVDAHVVEPPDVRALDRRDLLDREAELAVTVVEVLAPAPAELGVAPYVKDHQVQRERAVDLVDVAHRLALRVRRAARS